MNEGIRMRGSTKRKKDVSASLLDMEKSYERVQREKLCKALKSFGKNDLLLKARRTRILQEQ